MELTYLVKGEDAKEEILSKPLPSDLFSKSTKQYGGKENSLYFVTIEIQSNTVKGAKILARFRDGIRNSKHTYLLVDDPSAKFCAMAYPKFAEYERKLREVILLAMFAEPDNFNDKLVRSLSELSLARLGRDMFHSASFEVEVKEKFGQKTSRFTKEEVLDYVAQLDEETVWGQLFGDGVLPSVKHNYWPLNQFRNDVMHHHTIGAKQYEMMVRLLRESTLELKEYINHIRYDSDYSREHSEGALSAARALGERYANMFAELAERYRPLSDIALGGITIPFRNAICDVRADTVREAAERLSSVYESLGVDSKELASALRNASGVMEIANSPALQQMMESINERNQYLIDIVKNANYSGLANMIAGSQGLNAIDYQQAPDVQDCLDDLRSLDSGDSSRDSNDDDSENKEGAHGVL